MDESAEDRSPNPPVENGFKRIVFCSGKVNVEMPSQVLTACTGIWHSKTFSQTLPDEDLKVWQKAVCS